MDEKAVRRCARRHYKASLWLTVATTMVVLGAMAAMIGKVVMAGELLISVAFSLLSAVAYGQAWKAIALSSQKALTKFYLAAPMLRMLAAAMVVLVYAVAVRSKFPVLHFVGLFCTYYIVLLVFDCVFFAKVEKSNKTK